MPLPASAQCFTARPLRRRLPTRHDRDMVDSLPHATRRRLSPGRRLLLAGAAALAGLGLLEGALWLVHPLPPPPQKLLHRFLPSLQTTGPAPRTVQVDPGPLAGVTPGTVENAYNRLGYLFADERGRRTRADELRIAVVGGSTVECSALAADKRWSAVLEQLLQAQQQRPVTVLNLGISAQDTRTHLATTCHVVTSLAVDVCVFLIGTNDLGVATASEHPMLGGECYYPAPKWSQLLKDTWSLTQIARHLRSSEAARARTTPYFAEAAAFQARLPLRETDLQTTPGGLAAYARNVVSLAGLCKEHGIAVLFATQPSMFSTDPSPEELRAFWGCHLGDRRISAANFVALLDTVNEHLLATCREHHYACIDLAHQLPKGFACFYDQVHFNEAGARRVAEALVAPIRSLLP